MIHLVIREPVAYQRTLCQALSDSYKSAFVAWFVEEGEPFVPPPREDFRRRFISEVGYGKLYRELRSDPQPIVILGGWSSAIAHKTLSITRLLRVPVFIWTDHPHPRQRNWVFDRGRKAYLRILGKRVAGFLACGEPTVKHLESLGIAPEKITNFPYWVDLPQTWSPPKGCEENQEPLRLIAVGRQVSVKAFEVAIAAIALVNKNAGRCLATLELVGDGPERRRLEALAKSKGPDDVVKFSGWVENDQVWKLISDADALIIPSRFEPYGVVVLEALANGRPVLASDQVVAALDRDDGKRAIFFHPAGDPRPLAEQIRTLSENRNFLKASSLAARAIAEEWPPARAAAILQPILDQVKQHRTKQNSNMTPNVYDDMSGHPARPTSDPL
jgi:glycosyltransferase involved in cell wall biosynthesis